MKSISLLSARCQISGKLILDVRDLELVKDQPIMIVGPNGAGKSTLLRLLAGLLNNVEGAISLDGSQMAINRATKLLRRYCVYLHQRPYLFDTTVANNIAYGLKQKSLPKSMIKDKVEQALQLSGIGHLKNALATQLSGGESQRVAIARAWVTQPDWILLDEPTLNLDSQSQLKLYELLQQISHQGVGIIIASHDEMLMNALSVCPIPMCEGRIEQPETKNFARVERNNITPIKSIK